MRQSLECLNPDKSTIDNLSETLAPGESPEIFNNTYEMDQQRSLEEGAYASAIEVWKHEMNEA